MTGMLSHLAAVALLAWSLLGPAVCAAACAAPAQLPACHAPEASPEPVEPGGHSDEACCEEPLLIAQSALAQVGLVALPSSAPAGDVLRLAAPAARSRALPKPPDLHNSPYVRVTPPRLVYAGSSLS